MLKLKKPPALKAGDTVATVSLSWGGAGDEELRWRYEQGKQRLEEVFQLRVVEMPHTLAGTEEVYRHPEKRAQDLMDAFADPGIKAVIACIGGNDSIRMAPYIDFDVIRGNPKIFSGYSDSTITHCMCLKAGLSSFYGASVLTDFAENIAMLDYTREWVEKAWFRPEPLGEIPCAPQWTGEYLPWLIENKNTARRLQPNTGYELLQGKQSVRGRLIGGCADVLEMIKGTALFPTLDCFDGAILFLETSEAEAPPAQLEDWLRWYATVGILQRLGGILFGKPYGNRYYEEYKPVIRKVLAECGREELPVLYNASLGHACPIGCIPFGALAEITCDKPGFAILESAVE